VVVPGGGVAVQDRGHAVQQCGPAGGALQESLAYLRRRGDIGWVVCTVVLVVSAWHRAGGDEPRVRTSRAGR
jgi:hypothetical protein